MIFLTTSSASVFFVSAFLFLNSCSTKEVLTAFDPNGASLLSVGEFTSTNSHIVQGKLRFYRSGDNKILALTDFKTEAGAPHTHLYFCENLTGSNALDVGAIKTFSGDHYYTLNNSFETSSRPNILLWNSDLSANPLYAFATMTKI